MNLNKKNLEEFEKEKSEFINKCKQVIRGELKNKNEIDAADFNGVYIIINENNEIVYIGSAYTNKFKIKDRLRIHLNGHISNTNIVKHIQDDYKIKNKDKAKQFMKENFRFIACEYESLEYQLMENVPGLYNKKGNIKN